MAYDNDQKEFPLPNNGKGNQKSVALLPKYFRTQTNQKFLESTLDQMVQPGVAEKLNGFIGRKESKAYVADDSYINEISNDRKNYQLEPSLVIKNDLGNYTFRKDYIDYINQIANFGGNSQNQDSLNAQEYYAWNPNIDLDKVVNFREYYWLPNGPQIISIAGQSRGVESTYTVELFNNADNLAYIFSPDGQTQLPSLTLYRGQTYTFEINSSKPAWSAPASFASSMLSVKTITLTSLPLPWGRLTVPLTPCALCFGSTPIAQETSTVSSKFTFSNFDNFSKASEREDVSSETMVSMDLRYFLLRGFICCNYLDTSIPMLRAVPSIILQAASSLLALRSFCFVLTISLI